MWRTTITWHIIAGGSVRRYKRIALEVRSYIVATARIMMPATVTEPKIRDETAAIILLVASPRFVSISCHLLVRLHTKMPFIMNKSKTNANNQPLSKP